MNSAQQASRNRLRTLDLLLQENQTSKLIFELKGYLEMSSQKDEEQMKVISDKLEKLFHKIHSRRPEE